MIAFLLIGVAAQQTSRATLRELRTALCAGGFSASGEKCPPPSAAQRALVTKLAAEQKARDERNTTEIVAKIQELLDRPATVRVVQAPGTPRTIIVTRTICRTPSGKAC